MTPGVLTKLEVASLFLAAGFVALFLAVRALMTGELETHRWQYTRESDPFVYWVWLIVFLISDVTIIGFMGLVVVEELKQIDLVSLKAMSKARGTWICGSAIFLAVQLLAYFLCRPIRKLIERHF